MGNDSLLIGEVARQSGVSRKALRLYEAAGILNAPRRNAAGYRVYGADTLPVLAFVRQAQRLGFTLPEIKEVVAIKRAGRAPCPHIRDLVRRKADDLDQRLKELNEVREGLRALLDGWRSAGLRSAAVCPHIEKIARMTKDQRHQGGGRDGEREEVALPDVRSVPRSRDRGRRSADR